MNSNEEQPQGASSQKKTLVFHFSQKKHLLTRDWNEDGIAKSQEKNIKTYSKKKSVSFTKDIKAIPTPSKDFMPGTPNQRIASTEKRLKSCKEHIKTPYSKERVKDIDEGFDGNSIQNGGNDSNQGSKTKLVSAQKLSLVELKDQPIEQYLSSASKGKATPKGNDTLILSEICKGSLLQNAIGNKSGQKVNEDKDDDDDSNGEADEENEEVANEPIKQTDKEIEENGEDDDDDDEDNAQ